MGTIKVTDNQSKILSLVRMYEGISRTDISKKLNLSLPSISKHIERFIDAGLVYEDGFNLSSGGRRPIVLRYNYNRAMCLNVIVDGIYATAYLTNLSDVILASEILMLKDTSSQSMKNCVIELMKISKFSGFDTLVISLPGIIDGTTIIKSNLYPDLEGVNLEHFFELPEDIFFVALNDVDCKVYGKYIQSGHSADSVYYISYETKGIGSGLMLNGNVYRGFHYYAGELGYLEIDSNKRIHDILFDNHNLKFDVLVNTLATMLMSVMFTLDPQIIYLSGSNKHMNQELCDAVLIRLKQKNDFESNVIFCDKNHEIQIRGMLEFTMNEIETKL